jgi:hypothetical protein
MPGAPDPLYVNAREVLLDALEAARGASRLAQPHSPVGSTSRGGLASRRCINSSSTTSAALKEAVLRDTLRRRVVEEGDTRSEEGSPSRNEGVVPWIMTM